jgi:hypothetical protein
MAKLLIEGEEYPMPNLGDLNLEQARILKRYTGLSLEEAAELRASDPDLIAAFCHLAFQERDPTASFVELERRVQAVHLLTIDSIEEEADASPPPPGPSETESEPVTSGESSATTTDETPATTPISIGAAR